MTRISGLLLLLVAYALLYPGLTQPMLSLIGSVDQADLALIGKDIIVSNPETPELVGAMAEMLIANMEFSGTVEAYNRTRSILGTVQELYRSNHTLVAFLVALFSIIIPVAKGLMLLFSHFRINQRLTLGLQNTSNLVSKWSMADVFVIGVLVAFLAANAVEKEGGLLTFQATLGPGFYFFLAYCLLSILATQLLLSSRDLPLN